MAKQPHDAGVSTVEAVVLTPVVVLLLGFLPIEIGVWMHARNMAVAASAEASRAAAKADLSDADAQRAGKDAARNFIREGGMVNLDDITIQRDPKFDTRAASA